MLVWHFRDQEPFVDLFKFLSMLRGDFSFWSLICALMDKGILFLRQKKKRQTSRMTEIWNHVSVTFKLDIFFKSQPWEVRERALYNFGLPFETTDFFLEKSKPFLSKNIALSLSRWFRERHKKCHTNIFVNIETVPWHFF